MVITAGRLRECRSLDSLFGLLRELGYPVSPVAIAAEEWRHAGIVINWPDSLPLHLAIRVDQLDCYVLSGVVADDTVLRFLRSLQSYNVITKAVLLALQADRLQIFDVNKDYFEVRGIGYGDADIVALLRAVNAAYDPATIHQATTEEYKEIKTGRRHPWAEDRVM